MERDVVLDHIRELSNVLFGEIYNYYDIPEERDIEELVEKLVITSECSYNQFNFVNNEELGSIFMDFLIKSMKNLSRKYAVGFVANGSKFERLYYSDFVDGCKYDFVYAAIGIRNGLYDLDFHNKFNQEESVADYISGLQFPVDKCKISVHRIALDYLFSQCFNESIELVFSALDIDELEDYRKKNLFHKNEFDNISFIIDRLEKDEEVSLIFGDSQFVIWNKLEVIKLLEKRELVYIYKRSYDE